MAAGSPGALPEAMGPDSPVGTVGFPHEAPPGVPLRARFGGKSASAGAQKNLLPGTDLGR